MIIGKRVVTAVLISPLITLPLSSWAVQIQYLGQAKSVSGVDHVTTQYRYVALRTGDTGQYAQATLGHGAEVRNFYISIEPLTLTKDMVCPAGHLCVQALKNGDVTLYQYAYNVKTNPYRAISQKATYVRNAGGYYMIRQTRYQYNINGQQAVSIMRYRLADSKGQLSKWQTVQTASYYDALGRLISSEKSGQISHLNQYRYDANGNMLSRSGGTILVERYNGLDQSVGINHHSVYFDGNGNQENRVQGGTYAFNARNQLVGYSATPAGKQSLQYDYDYYANGYRADKTYQGSKLAFYHEGSQLLNTVDINHQQISHYLLANGRFYRSIAVGAQESSGVYALFGHNGDVLGHLNTAGQLTSAQQYDAYGHILSSIIAKNGGLQQSGVSVMGSPRLLSLRAKGAATQQSPFGYDGEYRDAETGLSYLRARYYSPTNLHFISQDSYFLMNRYRFVKNDPVDRVDPQGHQSFLSTFGGLLAGISGVALFTSRAIPDLLNGLASGAEFSGRGGVSKGVLDTTLVVFGVLGVVGGFSALADYYFGLGYIFSTGEGVSSGAESIELDVMNAGGKTTTTATDATGGMSNEAEATAQWAQGEPEFKEAHFSQDRTPETDKMATQNGRNLAEDGISPGSLRAGPLDDGYRAYGREFSPSFPGMVIKSPYNQYNVLRNSGDYNIDYITVVEDEGRYVREGTFTRDVKFKRGYFIGDKWTDTSGGPRAANKPSIVRNNKWGDFPSWY